MKRRFGAVDEKLEAKINKDDLDIMKCKCFNLRGSARPNESFVG
jgi:hypothetical protein